MQDDGRCCGTGTCLIDPAGRCWCGQQWDGEKMCAPAPLPAYTAAAPQPTPGVTPDTVAKNP